MEKSVNYTGLNWTMDKFAKFRHSSDKLMEFLNRWSKPLSERCENSSASLKAVLSDEQAANDYLEFEKHAKAGYQRYLKNTSEADKAAQLEEHLSELGVENLDDYKWKKWCVRLDGITNLIKKYKPEAYPLYTFFSDFAHGSVIAIRILQGLEPSPGLLEKQIQFVYSDYILSTKSFLDDAWGQIVTTESNECKKGFNGVALLLAL